MQQTSEEMMSHKAEHKEITKLEVILITIILSIDLKKYIFVYARGRYARTPAQKDVGLEKFIMHLSFHNWKGSLVITGF